jgi:hypothetical protein
MAMARRKNGKAKKVVQTRGALTLTKPYHKGNANSGVISLDCGDKVAADLRGEALEDVYERAAKTLGETVRALKLKYGKLNPGMQRMNLGNRIRKVLRAAA